MYRYLLYRSGHINPPQLMKQCKNPNCDNPPKKYVGKGKPAHFCTEKCRVWYNTRKQKGKIYLLLKRKDFCIVCGEDKHYHQCQLSIDHIDGNHKNNGIGNLQVLCLNCHALKTLLNGDHLSG